MSLRTLVTSPPEPRGRKPRLSVRIVLCVDPIKQPRDSKLVGLRFYKVRIGQNSRRRSNASSIKSCRGVRINRHSRESDMRCRQQVPAEEHEGRNYMIESVLRCWGARKRRISIRGAAKTLPPQLLKQLFDATPLIGVTVPHIEGEYDRHRRIRIWSCYSRQTAALGEVNALISGAATIYEPAKRSPLIPKNDQIISVYARGLDARSQNEAARGWTGSCTQSSTRARWYARSTQAPAA